MKRSISPDSYFSGKSPKLVHHSTDDVISHRLPYTLSDEHLSCLPVSIERKPPATYPSPEVRAARDRKLYIADAWDMLQPAIKIIFDDAYKPGVFCCTTIFRAVERACFGDPGTVKLFFDLAKKECEPHIAATILSLEKQIMSLEKQSSDPSVFLPFVYKCWLGFKQKMMFVSDLAMYQTCNGFTLWDVGQQLFHKQLSMAPQLQDQVISGILALITDERLGKTANNTSLLQNLMDMFHGQSTDVFEKPFLDSTSKFYAEQAEQVLQRSDITQYLKYVEGSLRAEEIKCEKHYYFFASCWLQLMKVLESQLLEAHACVFEEGFKVLMDEGRMDDLRRMYRLFSRADLVDYIDRMLRSYILAKGELARQEASLNELHTNIDKKWHQCFGEDEILDKTIRDCFEGMGLHVPGEFSDQEHWEEEDI